MEKDKLYELESAKCTLTDWLKAGLAQGMEQTDAKELGELVDMVKDLAEAKKYCMEACYYEKVVEAMEEGEEPRYGYSDNMGGNSGSNMGGHTGRRGYKPYIDQMPYMDAYMHDPDFKRTMKYGYTDWRPMMTDGDERYGKAYNEYQSAKRHYTETNSRTDKDEMNVHAQEHLNDSITTLRDIWKMADPELKKRMKTDLMNLTAEMTV